MPLLPSRCVGGDLLDDVLDPDVEEQRPLAVLPDLDQPRLEGVVLVVGDLVLADGVVHGVEHLAGEQVDALGRGVLDRVVRRLVGVEALGGVRAGGGGGRASARWLVVVMAVLLRLLLSVRGVAGGMVSVSRSWR